MPTAIETLKCYHKNSFDPKHEDLSNIQNQKGIYMVCVKDEAVLKKKTPDASYQKIDGFPIIYVGTAIVQDLRERVHNHFNGTARNSTLRKSLGSFHDWSEYREPYKDGKYKFDEKHEKELTRCMRDNLIVFYWVDLYVDIKDLEKGLINELDPPLNIAHNKGSANKVFRKKLKMLRK